MCPHTSTPVFRVCVSLQRHIHACAHIHWHASCSLGESASLFWVVVWCCASLPHTGTDRETSTAQESAHGFPAQNLLLPLPCMHGAIQYNKPHKEESDTESPLGAPAAARRGGAHRVPQRSTLKYTTTHTHSSLVPVLATNSVFRNCCSEQKTALPGHFFFPLPTPPAQKDLHSVCGFRGCAAASLLLMLPVSTAQFLPHSTWRRFPHRHVRKPVPTQTVHKGTQTNNIICSSSLR